jgi:hypothetical protein
VDEKQHGARRFSVNGRFGPFAVDVKTDFSLFDVIFGIPSHIESFIAVVGSVWLIQGSMPDAGEPSGNYRQPAAAIKRHLMNRLFTYMPWE